jgi:hypothetical protein
MFEYEYKIIGNIRIEKYTQQQKKINRPFADATTQ